MCVVSAPGGVSTLSVDVVLGVFVDCFKAGVVNAAGVDGPLVLSGHDELDLTPHIEQAGDRGGVGVRGAAVEVCAREWSKVCDGADLLPVIPGPLQVDVLRVEFLDTTAKNQQPLHLGNLRDAGDLEERWLHWRCVGGEKRG